MSEHLPEAEPFRRVMQNLDKLEKGILSGNASVNVNFGGISQWASLILSISIAVLLILSHFWWMLQHQALRSEMAEAQRDAMDRQQSWIGVWAQKVESLRAELRAEREKANGRN